MPTATDYYRALAEALDDLDGPYTTTAAAPSSVTAPLLVDTTVGASTNAHAGAWVFVASGTGVGQQRRVVGNGFVPATGAVTVEAPWTTEPSASVIDLTHLFPVATPPGGDTSYFGLLRAALRHIVIPHTIDVTTVANQQEYDLSAYAAWLTTPDRVTAVLDPPRASGWPNMPTWRRWEIAFQAGVPTLLFKDRAYPVSSATFQIEVVLPAFHVVNGAASTVGIDEVTDTAVPPVQDAVDVALIEAYRILAAGRAPGRPSGGNWRQLWADQQKIARRVRGYDGFFSREQEQPATTTQGAA